MKDSEMTTEELDAIGRLADKANNFAHATLLPLPAKMHAEQLSIGMKDIRDALRKIYVEASGDNPWEDEP